MIRKTIKHFNENISEYTTDYFGFFEVFNIQYKLGKVVKYIVVRYHSEFEEYQVGISISDDGNDTVYFTRYDVDRMINYIERKYNNMMSEIL